MSPRVVLLAVIAAGWCVAGLVALLALGEYDAGYADGRAETYRDFGVPLPVAKS